MIHHTYNTYSFGGDTDYRLACSNTNRPSFSLLLLGVMEAEVPVGGLGLYSAGPGKEKASPGGFNF